MYTYILVELYFVLDYIILFIRSLFFKVYYKFVTPIDICNMTTNRKRHSKSREKRKRKEKTTKK